MKSENPTRLSFHIHFKMSHCSQSHLHVQCQILKIKKKIKGKTKMVIKFTTTVMKFPESVLQNVYFGFIITSRFRFKYYFWILTLQYVYTYG